MSSYCLYIEINNHNKDNCSKIFIVLSSDNFDEARKEALVKCKEYVEIDKSCKEINSAILLEVEECFDLLNDFKNYQKEYKLNINQKAISTIKKWLDEESDYDEKVWPEIKNNLFISNKTSILNQDILYRIAMKHSEKILSTPQLGLDVDVKKVNKE